MSAPINFAMIRETNLIEETNLALKGVLLDIDGTLVLSNDAHAQAWVDAFAVYGYGITFEQVRPLIGMGGDQLMPTLIPDMSNEEGIGKEISDYRKQLFQAEYAPDLQPTNGARELVERLQGANLQVVIASSAQSAELDTLLKAAQVQDLIHLATTSSDADVSKPAPDIVAVALQKGKLTPDQTVMIGDTPYDIEAAGKAGVPVIAVRCGGFSDDQLKGAIAIYNDPADLLQQFESSPFGQLEISAVR